MRACLILHKFQPPGDEKKKRTRQAQGRFFCTLDQVVRKPKIGESYMYTQCDVERTDPVTGLTLSCNEFPGHSKCARKLRNQRSRDCHLHEACVSRQFEAGKADSDVDLSSRSAAYASCRKLAGISVSVEQGPGYNEYQPDEPRQAASF